MSSVRYDRSGWIFSLGLLSLASVTLGGDPPPDPSLFPKSRFISFNPDQPEALTSIRIWMVSLHHVSPPYNAGPSIPFSLFQGMSVWVGPPAIYAESSATPNTKFTTATTQCAPYYHNWSTVGLLHVTGPHIVPSSIYEVEQLSAACQGQEDTCTEVTPSLEVRTTRWCDVQEPFNPPTLSVQPSVADTATMVSKFRNFPGAAIKARTFLAAETAFGEFSDTLLSHDMGFSHIAVEVDAFRGGGYPYKMGKCTVALPPPSTGACSTDAECGANGPCNLYCPD